MKFIYVEECRKAINFDEVYEISIGSDGVYSNPEKAIIAYFNNGQKIMLKTRIDTKEEAEKWLKEFTEKYLVEKLIINNDYNDLPKFLKC